MNENEQKPNELLKEFEWTEFYSEFANALLGFSNNRRTLISRLQKCYKKIGVPFPKMDYDGNVRDVDPFTVFGLFNRNWRGANDKRIRILAAIKDEFEIKAKVPELFNGIPVLDSRNACYFALSNDSMRGKNDIDNLWRMFELAIDIAEGNAKRGKDFVDAWNTVIKQYGVGLNLTMGLYWIRPKFFVNLDSVNRDYISKNVLLSDKINAVAPKVLSGKKPKGREYVAICEIMRKAISEKQIECDSLPEFSHNAWMNGKRNKSADAPAALQLELPRPHFWKISHGSLNTGLSIEAREDTEKRKVVTMHRETAGIGTSPILQGDNFAYALRKGDFAYLCYAGEVRRLVQITDDECVKSNLVDGFVERSYRVIAEAKQIGKYAGTAYKKVWTPNQNSTFARIPTEEYVEFDKNILEPYFGMTVEKLLEKSSESPVARRYWWLMSDPSRWNMAEMSIGEEENYTLINENGNKRKEYSAFIGCREGDLLVGYVGKPNQHVCAILTCSRSLKAKKLYFRKIADIPNPVKRDEIVSYKKLGEMTPMTSSQGSIFGITKEQFDDIYALILKKNPGFKIGDADTFDGYEMDKDGGLEASETYTKEMFLNEVFMSSQKYDELVGLLHRKKNIILRGAPGVGKTFAARRLAYSLIGRMDKTRTGFVQFHQSYSYENFIRGYKPTANGGFELRDGVFLEFCKRAEEDPDNEYFFIIDEINRGNLSKIFGELLVLIEGDKRGKDDYAVKLAYGDEEHDELFRVPENLYLIGLMNTADRSLAMIDYALRRRFAFFTVEPALDDLKFRKQLTPELYRLASAVVKLNKTIENDPSLGKGFKIGHSYFCEEGEDGKPPRAQKILHYEIAPMLEEYWFEDPEKAKREIDNLEKEILA